jgi:hypothetical protein
MSVLALTGSAGASAVHAEFTVPENTAYVQVETPSVHGYLKYFEVDYTDGYIHKDPIPVADKVAEIDNVTMQAPDVQGWDGCAAPTAKHPGNIPDQLDTTDNDTHGLGGGTTPPTGLHHGVTVTITPTGSGKYFIWCHYEHGPETWVLLTYSDGSTIKVYFAGPQYSYFLEMFLSQGGTATSVSVTGADE